MKRRHFTLTIIAALLGTMGALAQLQDDAYLTPSQARKQREKEKAEYNAYLKQREAQREARRQTKQNNLQYEDDLIDFYNRRGNKRVTIEEMNKNYERMEAGSQGNAREKRGGLYASRLRRFNNNSSAIVLDNVDRVYILDDLDYNPYMDSYYGYDRRSNVSINIGFGNRWYWDSPYYGSPWAYRYGYYDPWYDPWTFGYGYDYWYGRPRSYAYFGWGYRPYGYSPYWSYDPYYSPYWGWGGYYGGYYGGIYYGGVYTKTYRDAPHGRGGYAGSYYGGRSNDRYRSYGSDYGRSLGRSFYRSYDGKDSYSRDYRYGDRYQRGRSNSWSNRSRRVYGESNSNANNQTYRSTSRSYGTSSSSSSSYRSNSSSSTTQRSHTGGSGGARARRR